MDKTKKHFSSYGMPKAAVVLGLSAALCIPMNGYAENVNAETVEMQAPQGRAIKGNVVDEQGMPMVGVTVRVVGAKNAVITDIDGNFSITAANNAQLEFSFVGYTTKKVAASNASKVALSPDVTGLEDIVVIGYGTVKKRDLSGSVSSVKAADIMRAPTANVMEAIQGQVAGLDITRSNGDAGSGVSMTLRGNRSINGSNSPLFIIDGMEGSYSELNPADIVSVEVLKDASSTAIYGAAGANGVIIITTKSAKKDKFSVDLNAYHGWNVLTSFPEVNTGEAYKDFRRLALKNAGRYTDESTLFPDNIQNYVDANKWVDWEDLATQTGQTDSYNLSTSYATDRSSSYMSVGYYKIEGMLKGDELERYSARAKFDFTPNKVVKYGLNVYAMYQENDKRSNRIWNRILSTMPLGDPFNEDGSIKGFPIDGDAAMNPIADNATDVYVNQVKRLSVTPQAYVELTPIKGLSLKSVIGGYFANTKTGRYSGPDSYQGMEYNDVSAEGNNSFTYNYKWQNILTYNFQIANDHDFTITGITEWSKNRSEAVNAKAYGFDTDLYAYHNLGAATGTPTVSSAYTQTQMMSYAGRINYSYLGRYIATASIRYDGSSMLAEGNKWDVFPAAAVAWRISDEPFMEKTKSWLDNLKLRVSYGVTGNAGAAAYATQDVTRTGIFGFQDTPVNFSGYSATIANKSLAWEKSYSWDIGLDFTLFNKVIDVTFDWYRTDTKDILYQKSLPYSVGGYASGAFKTWVNVGETRNTGVELVITSHNFRKKDFTWDTTLSFSKNNEEVIKTTQDNPLQFGDYYLMAGSPVHTYYGYKYAGLWSTAQAEEAAKYGAKPGQVRLEEVGEKDHKYTIDDYQIIGNADPKWSGSLLNNFRYKNFDLSILMIARWDWTIYNGVTGWYRLNGLSPSPAICDYWTEDNQGAYFPAPNADSSEDEYQKWINYMDGSYLKIKNITLGYTLPKSWVSKLNIERARIYFTATDPFIYTKCDYLENYDPEKGGDDDDTPLSKQFVLGINVSF